MRILLAPDKFKNSLTAQQACAAMEDGLQKALTGATFISFPMADGGDGTTDILVHHSRGRMVSAKVHDPLFRMIEVQYGLSEDGQTAYMDMARASGLQLLVLDERDVMETTTYGTGEMISDALDRGVRKFVLGIGGSGTNDGGIGAAMALGYSFYGAGGTSIRPIGKDLQKIVSIHKDKVNPLLKEAVFTVICDVDNPLYGERGAAYVYAPQKGASPEQVVMLDRGLMNLAKVIKNDFGTEIDFVPGAGAGGGLGGSSIVFLNTQLKKGIDVVFEWTGIEEEIKQADLVITGEGRADAQTLFGKLMVGVAALGQKHGKTVLGVVGKNELERDQYLKLGLSNMFSLMDLATEKEAIRQAYPLLSTLCQHHVAKYIQHLPY